MNPTSLPPVQPGAMNQVMFGIKKPDWSKFVPKGDDADRGPSADHFNRVTDAVKAFDPAADLPKLETLLAERVGEDKAQLVLDVLKGNPEALLEKLEETAYRTNGVLQAVEANFGPKAAEMLAGPLSLALNQVAQLSQAAGMLPMVLPTKLQELGARVSEHATKQAAAAGKTAEVAAARQVLLEALAEKAGPTAKAVSEHLYGEAGAQEDPLAAALAKMFGLSPEELKKLSGQEPSGEDN